MKQFLFLLSMVLMVLVSPAQASERTAVIKSSPELEQIKSLAGQWSGQTQSTHEEANEAAAVQYRVTSGGSAVVETLFPGTPHEMVSVYYDKNGQLAMTHYCMLTSRPELILKETTENQLVLEASNPELAGQMHMKGLSLEWLPDGQLVQTWVSVQPDGQPAGKTIITLKRSSS